MTENLIIGAMALSIALGAYLHDHVDHKALKVLIAVPAAWLGAVSLLCAAVLSFLSFKGVIQ